MYTSNLLANSGRESKMKQIQTENSFDAIHPIENLPLSVEVPIEVETWQLTRLNLMCMLNNEFNEYDEEIKELLKENQNFNVEKDIGFIEDYSLSIEYVEPQVHNTPPFWQYLISYGGPGSEIRFFVNDRSSTKPYKVYFCVLDWFTVVEHDVTGEDVIEHLWEQFLLPLTDQMETQNEESSPETQETDPLLALAGTLKWDDIGVPDPELPPEIRVVKGAHEDNPDPLLALAGTLQSDVSDVSERHDDYIAAALLAELRGDTDE